MLIVDDLDQIPEQFRDQYVKTDDGKFAHKGHLAVKGDMANYKNQVKEFSEKLSSFELAAEEAKKEKERIEREKLEKDNDYKAISERDREQFQREKSELLSQLKAMRQKELSGYKNADINEFSALATDAKQRKVLKALLSNLVEYREDGSAMYYDVDGKPLTADKDRFVDYINSSGDFDAFLPAPASSGAGSRGNTGGGSASTKKFEEYSGAELVELRKTKPQEYERLKAEFNNGRG